MDWKEFIHLIYSSIVSIPCVVKRKRAPNNLSNCMDLNFQVKCGLVDAPELIKQPLDQLTK